MRGQKKRRGLSLGTVVMLALTLVVLVGMGRVLGKLTGDSVVDIDAEGVMAALNLEGLFQPSMLDIPLQSATQAPAVNTAEPMATPQAPAQTAAPTPGPTPYAGGSVTLTIGGSVCVEDNVRQSGYYKDSKKYDLDEVFSLLSGEMTGDLTLVTLENLVYEDGKVSDLIAPEAALHMLRAAGVDVVSLGFQKALDKGTEPLLETVEGARAAGLQVLGAYGQEVESAPVSRMVEIGGVKLALLHYTDNLTSTAKKKVADSLWMLPTADNAEADIAEARQLGADVVLVSLHWGKSGTSSVTKAQRELAQRLADAGADVIVGAGSRIVQPAEWLTRGDGGETLCCYSLGSLLSDSRTDAGVAGMLLQLTIQVDAAGHVTIPTTAYTPTYIWRYKQDGSYHYRVVASDGAAPDGMDESQQTSRARAMQNTAKYLGEDCPLTVRIPGLKTVE